jgi:hypothetical protein
MDNSFLVRNALTIMILYKSGKDFSTKDSFISWPAGKQVQD